MTDRRPRKLTENQVYVLDMIQAQGWAPGERGTTRTLVKRGLLDAHGKLTEAGREALSQIRNDRARGWSREQAREFARSAMAQVGRDGWALLVHDLRVAVIEAKALRIVASQASDTVRTCAVEMLVRDMLAEAGLAEES